MPSIGGKNEFAFMHIEFEVHPGKVMSRWIEHRQEGEPGKKLRVISVSMQMKPRK